MHRDLELNEATATLAVTQLNPTTTTTTMQLDNSPTMTAIQPTPTLNYTSTILSGLYTLLGPTLFHHYALLVSRIFNNTHPAAASSTSFSHILQDPSAVLLHNEIARLTYSATLINNLPEMDEGSDSSLNEQFLDVADQYAGTEGARPSEAEVARRQVMQVVEGVMRKAEVGGLVEQMAGLGF